MCFASKFVCMCIHIYIVRCNYDIQFLSAIFDIYKMTTKYINIYHFFTPPSNLPKTTKGHTFVLNSFRHEKAIFHSSHGLASGPHLLPDICLQPWTHREDRFRSGPAAIHRHRVTPRSWRKFFKHDAWNYQIFLDFPLPVYFLESKCLIEKKLVHDLYYLYIYIYMCFTCYWIHEPATSTVHPFWRQIFIYGCFQK